MNKIKIINGQLLTPSRLIREGIVYVENGKICEAGDRNIDITDATIVDAQGCYVSPGFIDLHTHGAGNADFMDGTAEAFLTSAEVHAQHGTTALFPSTLASPDEDLFRTLEVYEQARSMNTKGASLLGFHLEAPYFAMRQRGGHDPRYLRDPSPDHYLPILSASKNIARWSAAPELPGSKAFAETLVNRGILPAIAHSDALYEETLAAYDWGFTHVTHLYSCTSTITRRDCYRYAGIVEASYLIEGMTVEIIADGVHLPASLLQMIYKFKGPEKIALITDSIRAAGMPDGISRIGSPENGQEIIVKDGVAKLLDNSGFAGSVATADRLVRTMRRLGEVPLRETIQMMTATPARIMHIDRSKGSLSVGKDADIVIFDEDIDIKMTMVNGTIVFKKAIEPKTTLNTGTEINERTVDTLERI